MDKLLAIMKPFMKKELMNVMHLHQSVETFHEYVPKEYLPEDYGGPKESLKTHYGKSLCRQIKTRVFSMFLNFRAIL